MAAEKIDDLGYAEIVKPRALKKALDAIAETHGGASSEARQAAEC